MKTYVVIVDYCTDCEQVMPSIYIVHADSKEKAEYKIRLYKGLEEDDHPYYPDITAVDVEETIVEDNQSDPDIWSIIE